MHTVCSSYYVLQDFSAVNRSYVRLSRDSQWNMYSRTCIFPAQHPFQSGDRGKKLLLEDKDAKDVAATATREGDMDGEGKNGAEGVWRTRASTQERG